MIKNILFDLDDTLMDFRRAEQAALTQTLVHMGITPSAEIVKRYVEINISLWKLLEKGLLTLPRVKRERYQMLFDEIGFAGSAEAATGYYENLLGEGFYLTPGAKETLRGLYPLCGLFVVTNGAADVQKKRLSGSGIEGFFEKVFISSEIGFDKPNPLFFERAFEQIKGFRREETVIVGDSLTSDIKGGKNAGIRTVWYNPRGDANTADIAPDYEIRRLAELFDWIKSEEPMNR